MFLARKIREEKLGATGRLIARGIIQNLFTRIFIEDCHSVGLLLPESIAGVTSRSVKMSCVSLSGLTCSPTKDRGQIQVIFGPMFSGKSTELMRRIKRFQIAKRECIVIKYAKDTRYSDDCISTHDKQVIPAVKATKLINIKSVNQFSVIGVDEGQFFPDIVPFCELMANMGKIVIVAALDGTFERKPFASILDLIPLAESVVKLSAVCNSCFREAAFTQRIGTEKEVEVIGGSDKYLAVCRQCFHRSPNRIGNNVTPLKSAQTKPARSPFAVVSDNRVNLATVRKTFVLKS